MGDCCIYIYIYTYNSVEMGKKEIDVESTEKANTSQDASTATPDVQKKAKGDEEPLDKAKFSNFWVGKSTPTLWSLLFKSVTDMRVR